jgi:hypothetical protein
MSGIYGKTCAYDYCQQEFFGRYNQVYCDTICKQHANNRKAAEARKINKRYLEKLDRAINILRSVFKADKNGECIVPKLVLEQLKFPSDCPYIQMKDDRYELPFSAIGPFALQLKGNNFLIIKKRKYGTSTF